MFCSRRVLFMWILLATISAFLTALTGTISKAGLERVGSTFGFAIQSTVVVFVAWLVVLVQGDIPAEVAKLEPKSLGLLAAAGVVSCVAFLFYFGALALGDSSRVQPLDRISLVFAIVLGGMFLKEKITPQIVAGATLMACGALIVAFAKTDK